MSNFLKESLLLKDFQQYSKLVAESYEKAPSYDASKIQHWEALNQSNQKWYKILSREVEIKFVPGEPYETQEEMKNKVQESGILLISSDHNEHPYFSKRDNLIFRAVHDYLIHIKNNTPFGQKGEIRSYNFHARVAPKQALPALFTEVVGQACYAVVNGNFPEQKIATLDEFDFEKIGYVKGYKIVNKELVKENRKKLIVTEKQFNKLKSILF